MIRGKQINLRVIREKDLDTLFELLSDIENRGEYFPVDLPSEPDFRKKFLEDGFWCEEYGRLLIVDKEDRILGHMWCFKSVSYFDALEIAGILFDPEYRNKGLMTEALGLLVRFLFETKKINRLQLTVAVGNEPSKRVVQKCGFKSEGVARQALFQKGRNIDVEWFSLLRTDYQTGLAKP